MKIEQTKNVEVKKPVFVKEVGYHVPVFRLNEPAAKQWNEIAEEKNTEMFIEVHDRLPEDYHEVLNWVRTIGSGNEENHSAENTMAFNNEIN